MRKVFIGGYTDRIKSIIVNENDIIKGIKINDYDGNDICFFNKDIKEVKEILKGYQENNIYMFFHQYLEANEIEYTTIDCGYYTKSEFKNNYGNGIIVTYENEDIYNCEDYYNLFTEEFYYDYHDGHNWITLELLNEGEKVEKIKTVEYGNTYTKDLYFNIDENEYFIVFNSFYQGTLLEAREVLDEEEVKLKYKI